MHPLLWYPQLSSISLRGISVPLPPEFITYLFQNGIVFPDDNKAFGNYVGLESDDSSGEDLFEGADTSSKVEFCSFDDFQREVEEIILELGGSVFPKLNGTSPKDANWMSTDGTLRCRNFDQILLLLKSSDVISEEVDEVIAGSNDSNCVPQEKPVLFLKKYYLLEESSLFRCFVHDGRILGITQKNCLKCYQHLKVESHDIETTLLKFLRKKVLPAFQKESYVVDVYLSPKKKAFIVDVEEYNQSTVSPCLFSWEELGTRGEDKTIPVPGQILRVIHDESGIVLSEAMSNRLPHDLKDGQNIQDFINSLSTGEA